jgi:hypothetical protein
MSSMIDTFDPWSKEVTAISATNLMNFVLAVSILEGLVLFGYHRLTGKGLSPKDYALNLTAGLCLMMALRSVSAEIVTLPIANLLLPAFLISAGVAHWTDLYQRWNSRL